ncbi:type II secretion system minor pseudopilin GspK [Pseudomonas sp. JDS28PS106]|uniref:general secretion pathway protein GspK n=1 Tax=Pseudomonas sp. JDS28PS106 TaxID=2497235 RepID=UPI002FD4F289
MTRQRGMALLLVLWAQALLTVALGALVIEVRQQMRLAAWQRSQLQATLAAEAGISLAIIALGDTLPARRWVADGQVRIRSFESARLEITVRSERGKLDLNTAPGAQFVRLLTVLGAPTGQARALGEALDRRRGAGQPPLRAVEELRDLATMNSALYRAVAAEVTVWSGLEAPDPAFASEAVRSALRLPHIRGLAGDPGQALEIRARAYLPDGASARVDSTVVLSGTGNGASPYRVVRYDQ